jgi:hypothetical protein
LAVITGILASVATIAGGAATMGVFDSAHGRAATAPSPTAFEVPPHSAPVRTVAQYASAANVVCAQLDPLLLRWTTMEQQAAAAGSFPLVSQGATQAGGVLDELAARLGEDKAPTGHEVDAAQWVADLNAASQAAGDIATAAEAQDAAGVSSASTRYNSALTAAASRAAGLRATSCVHA